MEIYLSDETELEQAYIREEHKLILHRALKKIPIDYRQAIWLVYFEDMSNDEAARAMKKSSRQIRNLLYRGKQSLKRELEKEGFIYEELG
jgi:RNA polymerase sigma-70 factor (ECF subfamily)